MEELVKMAEMKEGIEKKVAERFDKILEVKTLVEKKMIDRLYNMEGKILIEPYDLQTNKIRDTPYDHQELILQD